VHDVIGKEGVSESKTSNPLAATYNAHRAAMANVGSVKMNDFIVFFKLKSMLLKTEQEDMAKEENGTASQLGLGFYLSPIAQSMLPKDLPQPFIIQFRTIMLIKSHGPDFKLECRQATVV
jgi:hypothetical protein